MQIEIRRFAFAIVTLLSAGLLFAQTPAQKSFTLEQVLSSPFPAGLKMVAGQARPVTVQSTDVVWWACGGSGGARSQKFVRVPAHCGTIHMTYHGRTRKCPT